MDAWLYPADVLAALMRPLTHDPIVIAGQRNVDPQGYFGPLERPVRGVVRRLTNVPRPVIGGRKATTTPNLTSEMSFDVEKSALTRDPQLSIARSGPCERWRCG